MTTLPRPDVTVSIPESSDSEHKVDVMVSRDNKAKTYTGTSSSPSGAIKEVVEKILNDPTIVEMLP